MAAVEGAFKGKAIDTLLREPRTTGAAHYGYEEAVPDSAAWPEASSTSKAHEREEDLYGYGDGAPTSRDAAVTQRAPRRSSLKMSGAGPRRASISYSGEMTLNLPSGKSAKKRSSITFNDQSQVQEIVPVADMVDDPNRLWFQKEEYSHIQQKIYAIIDGTKKGDNESKALLCTRGLEPLMGGSNYYERKEAYENVLEETKMQKAKGQYDDEYIRSIYQFHTVESKVMATERADRDAKEVEKYLQVTRKMCRRLSC